MNALALGGADCVWRDVSRSEDLLGEDWWDVCVACNDIGTIWPRRLDHWCSLHASQFKSHWREAREGNQDYETWSEREHMAARGHVDRHLESWEGSSGLFCVQVALEVGAERVVCCGIPMDRRPHFNTDHDWASGINRNFRDPWEDHLDELEGRVRSLSGWTRELLGAPTAAWIVAGAPRLA